MLEPPSVLDSPAAVQTGAIFEDPAAALGSAALDDQIIGGLRWVSAATVVVELAGAGTSVAVARLVSPEQYGLAVIALLIPVLASILTYEGFGTPLVLSRIVDRADLEAATSASLAIGVVLSLLTLLFARTLAPDVFDERMVPLFELAAPAFIVYAGAVVPRAILSRRLHWRLMSASDIGGAVTTAVLSLALAILGWGSKALVVGALAGGLATTAVLWTGVRPVRPRWHRDRIRAIARVGTSAAGAGIAMTFRRNIDYVMLAVRLPPHYVGIYWRGFSLGVDQQSKVSGVTTRVAVSVLPRSDRGDDLRHARSRLVRLNTLVIFPLLGILVATAPWFVPAVYGHRWAGAVVPTQVLAVGGMVWATLAGMEGALFAAGAPAALAVFNVVSLITVGAVAYFVAPLGVVTVAVAMAALELVTLGCAQYFLLGKRVHVTPQDAISDVLPAAVAAAVMVIAAAPIASALATVVDPLVVVAVTGLFGLCLYGLIVLALFPRSWQLLSELRRAAGVPRLGGRSTSSQPVPVAAGQDGSAITTANDHGKAMP